MEITTGLGARPPKPDALLTIASQLEALCREWEAAAPGHAGDPAEYCLKECAKQLRAMVDSIKVVRRSGIYCSDDFRMIIQLLRDHDLRMAKEFAELSKRLPERPKGHWEYIAGPEIGGTICDGIRWVPDPEEPEQLELPFHCEALDCPCPDCENG